MAQETRTLATLPENPSPITSTHIATQLSTTTSLDCLAVIDQKHTHSTKTYVQAKQPHT